MSVTINKLSERLQERRTLYISSSADSILLRGSKLVVVQGETERVFPFASLRRVVLLGKPSFDCSILYALLRASIPVDWLDRFGRPMGEITSLDMGDGGIRLKQAQFCASGRALELARDIIVAKIENTSGLARRRAKLPPMFWAARTRALNADSNDGLRGAEGTAARAYFSLWGEWTTPFSWSGRKPYPAPDPVNMLLSLGYGLLHNRLSSALRSYGLDPRQGFFHVGRGTHCALASDLMEDMRFAVDATVLKLVKSGRLSQSDFRMNGNRCVTANNEAFSLVFDAFERMFCREWACVDRDGNTGARCTLNDRIDLCAESFCDHIRGKDDYLAFRRTQWATAS